MADSAAQKKPGFIQRIKRFFKDARGEMKKIVWPGKDNVRTNTTIVIVVVALSAVFVGFFDFIVTFLIRGFAIWL